MSDFRLEPIPPLDVPFDLTIVDDEVVFLSKSAISFAMTIEAAAETAERLACLLIQPHEHSDNDQGEPL